MKVSNMSNQLKSVLNRSKILATENNKKNEAPITNALLDFSVNDQGNNRISDARSGRKKSHKNSL